VLDRVRERAPEPVSPWPGAPLAALSLAVLVGLDLLLGSEVSLVGVYAIVPFLAATGGIPRQTALISAITVAVAALSGTWNDNTFSGGWWARLTVIVAAGLIAIFAARAASRARRAIFRLRLLDRVGRIADGSLPLGETLDKVTEAVVPAFTDLCMIDAIRDGDVRRIAVEAAGIDAELIKAHIRTRTPSTPEWLRDPGSDTLAPQFVPSMPEEVLQRMANDPADLEFLRWLRASSYVIAPLVSRGRSLGAFTVVRLRGSEPLRFDDVEFVAALASRIAVALDNAGLFSDLESVERRMDSVMESVQEAVLVHDSAANLVYANSAASELVGLGPVQSLVAGDPLQLDRGFVLRDESGALLPVERLPRRRALAGDDPEPVVFRLIDMATGRDSWRLERSSPIRGPSGDVLYAVTTVQDVTDVKQAELAQRALAESAEAIASASDYVSALQALTQAVVPQLADWCSVNVPGESGELERIAAVDDDAQMLELNELLRDGFEVRDGLTLRMSDVMRASRPVTAQLPSEPLPGWVLLKPIRAEGGAIGVMTLVNRAGRHPFSTTEIRLARAVADRAGLAILNARLASERAAIAETLQRELLPPLLPDVSGWSLAAMYRPAGEQNRAGGDFYDVFEGENGWFVVLGDVEGHGAEAAALTAMVRYTIRTAAMLGQDVASALEILNTQLYGREQPRLCSVVCLEFSSADEASVISAGHPLPLLVSAGSVREVGLPGSVLGALDDPQWSPVRFKVSPGDELVVYTDGVVEARRDGERFGRERLGSVLRGVGAPGDAVTRVGEAIDGFAELIEDDAAMVVLRRERRSGGGGSDRKPLAEAIE
jgi:GAF domain-containing protein